MARVTQRDIAAAAGVSQAAVSMVLNGKAEQYQLAPETRAKIEALMAEMGYVPDVASRSLRGRRNDLIGVHTYEAVFPVAANDYFHDFLVGIEEAAVAARVDLVLFASTQGSDGTRSAYTDRGNRLQLADGTIVLGLTHNEDELERLARDGVHLVFIGRRTLAAGPIPYVTADYASAVMEIVDLLVAAGHTRLAYFGRADRLPPFAERYRAFRTQAEASTTLIVGERFSEAEVTVAELRALLDSGTTAVLCETEENLASLLAAAEHLGVAIPGELSIAVLERPRDAASWSHIALPKQQMGREAVRLLLGLLDGTVPLDAAIELPCSIEHTTASIAPARA